MYKKRKAPNKFDYLYGIITTATNWSERIYCTKGNYHIDFTKDILDDAKFHQERSYRGNRRLLKGRG
ncbi:unnamed protein product [Rhizophagus irregularis]|nr:unnamed protein product [Rhizophagus irregularis]